MIYEILTSGYGLLIFGVGVGLGFRAGLSRGRAEWAALDGRWRELYAASEEARQRACDLRTGFEADLARSKRVMIPPPLDFGDRVTPTEVSRRQDFLASRDLRDVHEAPTEPRLIPSVPPRGV